MVQFCLPSPISRPLYPIPHIRSRIQTLHPHSTCSVISKFCPLCPIVHRPLLFVSNFFRSHARRSAANFLSNLASFCAFSGLKSDCVLVYLTVPRPIVLPYPVSYCLTVLRQTAHRYNYNVTFVVIMTFCWFVGHQSLPEF